MPAHRARFEPTMKKKPNHEVAAPVADVGLTFEITQRPDFALLAVNLQKKQRVFSEPSAMATMSPTIDLKAGLHGGLGKSLGRMFAGESLVINTYTAERGDGEVTFAPGPMGDIVHYQLQGNRLMLQSGAFLAHSDGVELSAKWGGAKGFFSGQGLVLLQATGYGDLFFNTYGALLEVDVVDDYYVDTGNIVAFEDTLQYNISVLPGLSRGSQIKSFLFGGEGIVCHFKGEGRLWIQTRKIYPFLNFIGPYRPTKAKKN